MPLVRQKQEGGGRIVLGMAVIGVDEPDAWLLLCVLGKDPVCGRDKVDIDSLNMEWL